MPAFTQEQFTYQVQPLAPTRFFTPVVTVLIALLLAGSCSAFWFGRDFLYYFVLNHPQVMGWKIWQYFTYSFIDLGGWNLLVDLCVIFFCGSAVERLYKSRNLAIFCLLVIPLFGLIMLPVIMLFDRIPFVAGADVLFYGILGMFAYSHRKQRMMLYLWAMEADKAAWLCVALNALLSIFMPYRLIFVPAAFLGWWYIKLFKGAGIRIGKSSNFKSQGSSKNVRKTGFVDID